jgi:hypothetical protein
MNAWHAEPPPFLMYRHLTIMKFSQVRVLSLLGDTPHFFQSPGPLSLLRVVTLVTTAKNER